MARSQVKSDVKQTGLQSPTLKYQGKRPRGVEKDKDTEPEHPLRSPPTSNAEILQSLPVFPTTVNSQKCTQKPSPNCGPREIEQPYSQHGHDSTGKLDRKRKGSQDAEDPAPHVQDGPSKKRARISLPERVGKEGASDINSTNDLPIEHWRKTGNWPKKLFEPDPMMSQQQLTKKRSSSSMSYSQGVKAGAYASAHTPGYDESKDKINFKVETHDIKDETSWGGGKADDHIHTKATPTTIQNTLVKEEEDDDVKIEDIARDLSPFRVEPGFWDGLCIPEPNPADEDTSLSETCSGEGESLISFSDAELEEDYLFQPEPEPVAATIRSVKHWSKTSPSKTFATLQIKEGPKDVFGHTIILFGIPTKFISRPNGDLDFVPYGSEAATRIWDAHDGFKEWKGFREISQALFFRHGGLNSWMYRDLLPGDNLHFDGCSSCPGHCYCWWTNMRNFRRKLEQDIINDRMVFWVAQMVEQNSDQLMTVWSNLDEDNPSRRRCIWRDLLRKEDIHDIFEPLCPGVDIMTILEKEEKDGEDGHWKQWLYDSAAWLADDIFAYHVSQGKLGEEVPRVVFDRYARIRDTPKFQYVPTSLESLPTRGNFKYL